MGIPEIDRLLGGGSLRGSIILAEETGSERSNYPSFFLCMKFLNEGLSRGEHAILILTEHLASEYLWFNPVFGTDLAAYRSSGLLTVVDAFSGYAGSLPQNVENQADIWIENPSNTTKLFNEIRSLLTRLDEGGYHNKTRITVDSLSTLVTATSFQKVWSLLLGLEPIHRTTGCTTTAIYFPGMHPPQEVESCERLIDGVVEFRGVETGDVRDSENFVQIRKMRRSPFLKERITYSRENWAIKFYGSRRLL